jgi:hypothetical protein
VPTSVTCPACGTEQTSAYGYAPAQTVRCRRCDGTFQVPGPKRVTATVSDDEDDDEPQPRSKAWLYAGAFFVLAGFAVVGLTAYVQQQRERADEEQIAAEEEREAAERRAARAARPNGFGKGGPFVAPPPNLRFDATRPTPEQIAALSKRLVGVWRTAAPEPPREVEYRADGSFRDGKLDGTWKATGALGARVLTVERSAGRSPLRVTFEGDELIHDGEEPGTSAVLRKP